MTLPDAKKLKRLRKHHIYYKRKTKEVHVLADGLSVTGRLPESVEQVATYEKPQDQRAN